MTNFSHYSEYVGSHPDKHYKATLFLGTHLMVGLNCLDPGQNQPIHEHSSSDKVYIVMEGRGWFTIGEETREAGPGDCVWAPSGVRHGIENRGSERLSVIIGIAPPPT